MKYYFRFRCEGGVFGYRYIVSMPHFTIFQTKHNKMGDQRGIGSLKLIQIRGLGNKEFDDDVH